MSLRHPQLFIRHPKRRGKDVETTRRSCEKCQK